jgi:hypothetical protein
VADVVSITFLYAIGQRVRWSGDGAGMWLIVARHYREGPDYGVVGYGMVRYDDEQRLLTAHAAEVDLSAVEGEGTLLLR